MFCGLPAAAIMAVNVQPLLAANQCHLCKQSERARAFETVHQCVCACVRVSAPCMRADTFSLIV